MHLGNGDEVGISSYKLAVG